MSYQQMPRKSPPQVPPQTKAPPPQPPAVPESGLPLAVANLRCVLEAAHAGGWPAWKALAEEMTIADRTALAEFSSVLMVVPPASPPPPAELADHMRRILPTTAATASDVQTPAPPSSSLPTIPLRRGLPPRQGRRHLRIPWVHRRQPGPGRRRGKPQRRRRLPLMTTECQAVSSWTPRQRTEQTTLAPCSWAPEARRRMSGAVLLLVSRRSLSAAIQKGWRPSWRPCLKLRRRGWSMTWTPRADDAGHHREAPRPDHLGLPRRRRADRVSGRRRTTLPFIRLRVGGDPGDRRSPE